jgi:Rieske Fe-S protein
MLDAQPCRRTLLVGAGLGAAATAVAACSTYDKKPDADGDSPPTSSASSSAGAPAAPAALAKTADIPVGSGVIVDDVVVTQPTAGDFKGFSSVCTHAGCNVAEVVDAVIKCPCHGSEFGLDGAVVKGPATKPLATKAITVQGDSIVAG